MSSVENSEGTSPDGVGGVANSHADAPLSPLKNSYSTITPSYKDALLSESGSSNRMGINTFKLLHLLQKKQNIADIDAGNESDDTNPQTNKEVFDTCRMRFQMTLLETTQETFLEDFVNHLNNILEVVNINTPGVKLAPWHTEIVDPKELIESLPEDSLMAVKYLYGFKAGFTKAGPQYLRLNMAFPKKYMADDIIRKNKNSIMIPGKQSLLKANSQSINPVTIGWFLRSNPAMADFDDLEMILKKMWQVKSGFGLYWASVKNGAPYDLDTTARAIHIETEEALAPVLIQKAEKTYGQSSSNMDDYPLGMNMLFIRPITEVRGSAKDFVKKYAVYQRTNEALVTSSSWFGDMALERSISRTTFTSLRQWLMSVNSIHQKQTVNGALYNDKLFTGIHRSRDTQEVKFYYYRVNETEAQNVVSALPFFIKDELGLDPTCFFHQSDFNHLMDGQWDKEKRCYISKNMLNQEQYLSELEDYFQLNRQFLPEVIVQKTNINASDMAKQVAMANGEDEVSVISNLTEKTLKAATSVTGKQSTAPDDTSTISGMTSKSKTQLAVREAIKGVSLEHNKVMKEQQQKFQKEIDALRKALEKRTHVTSTDSDTVSEPKDGIEDMHPDSNQNPNEQTAEEVQVEDLLDDSSDDDVALVNAKKKLDRTAQKHSLSKSPVKKRSKRLKFKQSKGKGGPASTSIMSDE